LHLLGGGPFGFEESLLASTPAVCFWGLLAFTLLWALPQVGFYFYYFLCRQALCISEIATRFPYGYNQWIVSAFGPFVGFMHSIIRVAFSICTNAVYATLFTQYFMSVRFFWLVFSPFSLGFGSR
jgi:serine/threonine-protein phosphatase 2A regulatory subunit B'